MNIELRKLKTSAALSEETIAFSAEVWVDGKYAFHAENHGQGGATEFHPALNTTVNGTRTELNATLGRINAYLATLPKHDPKITGCEPMELDLELWINVEIGRIQDQRRLDRAAKKAVLFSLPGDDAKNVAFRSLKAATPGDRERAKRRILQQHPNATIIAE